MKWNKEVKNKLRGGLDGSGKRFKKNQQSKALGQQNHNPSMLPGEGAPDTLHEVIDAPTYGRFRNYICTCTETEIQ